MPKYQVIGQALAPVDVLIEVEASNEKEAMIKASEEFDKGNRVDVRYTDDDAAATNYTPFSASTI